MSLFLQVNYVKTIDTYLIGCFLFVFATLAEFSLVLFLAARMKRYQQTKEYRKEKRRKEIETDLSKAGLLSNEEHLANGVSDFRFFVFVAAVGRPVHIAFLADNICINAQ